MNSKKDKWNESFERGENNILYPQTEVVRFLNRFIKKKINYEGSYEEILVPKNKQKRIRGLDFACGVGRHAILFEEFAMDAFGVDISNIAIAKAKENASFFNFKRLEERFTVLEKNELPFKNNFFNFSVAESCLDSMTFENAKTYFKELMRVSSDYVYLSLISFDDKNPVGETILNTDHERETIQYFFNENKIKELVGNISCSLVYFKKISETSEIDKSSESRFYCVFKK